MALTEKAFLEIEGSRDTIPCMFNPAELAVSRSNSWAGVSLAGQGVPQVKYLGAAYLIVVGIRRLAGLEPDTAGGVPAARSHASLYRQGIVVNTLNPKTALFFLAFLPQFISEHGAAWAQILVLGLIFACLGAMSDGCWALVAGTLGERLRRSTRFPKIQRYVSGSVFVGLGAVAALSAPAKSS